MEEPAVTEEAAETVEEAPAAAGRVYWLNLKPESDEALQEIAAMYTEETGVPVTVVTAASGTYNETLTAEMDKTEAPTLFVAGNQAAVDTWSDYCYDLTGTPIADELNTDSYMLYDTEAEFTSGAAVFFPQGNWEWPAIEASGMTADEVTMIPYYCGVEGEEKAGLNNGTENYWAVNAKASEEDVQATLDFMYWLVTNEAASEKAVASFGAMPYTNAAESSNPFLAISNEYAAKGNYNMWWATNYQPNVDSYRDGLVAALNQYDADQSDANWETVVTAFVQGWATQYEAAYGK